MHIWPVSIPLYLYNGILRLSQDKNVIGHIAVALAAKRVAPRTSLGTLAMAVEFTDLLWPIFLLLGWEEVRIAPGTDGGNAARFCFLPDFAQPPGGYRVGITVCRSVLDWKALPERRFCDLGLRDQPLGPRRHFPPA